MVLWGWWLLFSEPVSPVLEEFVGLGIFVRDEVLFTFVVDELAELWVVEVGFFFPLNREVMISRLYRIANPKISFPLFRGKQLYSYVYG